MEEKHGRRGKKKRDDYSHLAGKPSWAGEEGTE